MDIIERNVEASVNMDGLLAQGYEVAKDMSDIALMATKQALVMGKSYDAAHATRIVTTYARLIEALARAELAAQRLSGPVQQVVTVNHVHISQGGQAIVAGAVSGGGHNE